jgi:NAD(P)-dependent dehydrogenase (short-subunit alcohol dehydrogenase family)
MSLDRDKPVALVTGAGRQRGIGFEVARQLGQRGFGVVVTARDLEAAEERAAELRAEGLLAVPCLLDVTDATSVAALRAELEREPGRLDVLVNNAAGVAPYGESVGAADLAGARAVMEATLFGSWRMVQALLPLLRKAPHPRIVNVSSGAGSHGDPLFGLTTTNSMGPSYAVAKAALNALTARLAKEERGNRVLVNAVCPGFTATFDGAEAMGARPVAEGASSVVWAALLPNEGPTGGFFRDGLPLSW